MSDNKLSDLLASLKIAMPLVSEIKELAKSGNYQLACQRHFEVTHPRYQEMKLVNIEFDSTIAYSIFFYF